MDERDICNTIAHQEEIQRDIRQYEFKKSCNNQKSVVGCLKNCSKFWKYKLQVSEFIQKTIEDGYVIPFTSAPPPFYAKNNKSSLDKSDFVQDAIQSLLNKRCISEVNHIPKCCNPLSVATKNSKPRLVLDLRHVNQYVKYQKVKYEDLKTFSELFDTDDYFITFDLTSGYHHVDIIPEHKKYLGFQWTFPDGTIKYYVFNVLPFGLSSACYIFTKLLRPFVKKWRLEGIKSIVFLDDGICGGKGYEFTEHVAKIVLKDLREGGWQVNFTKSCLKPMQSGKWLGIEIDTSTSTFRVPQEKIKKLLSNIKQILSQTYSTPKQLSRIAGQVASMHLALGPIVRLFTRNLYRLIESRITWYEPIVLTNEAIEELNFWLKNIHFRNGFTFKPRPTTSKMIFTDASESGYGGFIAERLNKVICVGRFDEFEKATSSTARELSAINYVLKSFGSKLKNESIQINIDNISAVRILSVGSSKQHLHLLSLEIFNHCVKNNINLQPNWVPREMNRVADYYSKYNDTDDWSIDNYSFNILSNRFGPFTVDRFADNFNRKTLRFNSKFYCPQTESVNCFTNDWSNENNYLCPPISLIGSTIRHLKLCNASGTLIVPVWPSAYYWPLIYPCGQKMAHFIKDFLIIEPFLLPIVTIRYLKVMLLSNQLL